MDWLDEVRIRLKKGNQVLFAKDTEFLQDLSMLFREQSHKTMVLWAIDVAAESVEKLEEKYPDETRPREALEAAGAWAEGKIKMRLAQRKILDCHAFAKEIDGKEHIALCHWTGLRRRPHSGTRHGIPDVRAQRHRLPARCGSLCGCSRTAQAGVYR